MSAAFNIAPPGYTPETHPQRGMKPDRETIERMFKIAGTVAENLNRVFPDLTIPETERTERK